MIIAVGFKVNNERAANFANGQILLLKIIQSKAG